MSDAITTGVFGTLILFALGYLINRVDRIEERLSARLDALTDEVHTLGERVARLEGRHDAEPPRYGVEQ